MSPENLCPLLVRHQLISEGPMASSIFQFSKRKRLLLGAAVPVIIGCAYIYIYDIYMIYIYVILYIWYVILYIWYVIICIYIQHSYNIVLCFTYGEYYHSHFSPALFTPGLQPPKRQMPWWNLNEGLYHLIMIGWYIGI